MIPDFSKLLKEVVEGDESAWLALLRYFYEKIMTDKEIEQVKIYVKQSAKTNVHAIYIQAFLYDHGIGVKQNYEMAFLYMREAAGKGHPGATYEAGRRYLFGVGIEKNEKSAMQWLGVAAGSPHYYPAAMYLLGLMYEQGLSVDKDPIKAKMWYEKAAEKGYRNAEERGAAL